jgi:uncharacterized membrane protein YgdD (TMEM256/DUF423 family)
MNHRFPLLAGSLMAALGVALGAFGAHGLRHVLETYQLEWWHTAVEYQMWHGIGLVALAACRLDNALLPAALLTAGTVVFSGSLYLLALTGQHWLGIVTPFGGLMLLSGWIITAFRAFRL